ncbi:hypothetical protein RGQ29_005452 [Quercus rubra]|uniref:Uncharacterized protein n=1 Tax=Quercus rubra TaxID=3512 RepID=A0AAN7E4M2_QUERU|nr:hypothetical protein RGQ29_005452 [Quercus rubra]KAK4562972.1 hypothetical protein RGQ29_005452 [Quercus rubra]
MIAFRDSGFLSRNCIGISDLYGFILYTLVIALFLSCQSYLDLC